MADRTSVWSQSLARFRAATASRRPTPGCGAVAAVSADLSLALVVKGLRISEARQSAAERAALLQTAQRLLGRPGALADDDMRAFSKYLTACRRRDAAAEAALDAASRDACAIPLATAHCCLRALDIAVAAWPLVVPAVRSDIQAGGLLIHAALSAVLLNVDTDAQALRDPAARAQVQWARRQLQADADRRLGDAGWAAQIT